MNKKTFKYLRCLNVPEHFVNCEYSFKIHNHPPGSACEIKQIFRSSTNPWGTPKVTNKALFMFKSRWKNNLFHLWSFYTNRRWPVWFSTILYPRLVPVIVILHLVAILESVAVIFQLLLVILYPLWLSFIFSSCHFVHLTILYPKRLFFLCTQQ